MKALGSIVQYSTLLYGSRMIFPKLNRRNAQKNIFSHFFFPDSILYLLDSLVASWGYLGYGGTIYSLSTLVKGMVRPAPPML